MPALRALRIVGGLMLAAAAITAITAGVLGMLFGEGLTKVGGAVFLGLGFWGFVLVLDSAFGRPPQFSKRPWERPWEHEDRPS